jgi:ankyrin repeat protein
MDTIFDACRRHKLDVLKNELPKYSDECLRKARDDRSWSNGNLIHTLVQTSHYNEYHIELIKMMDLLISKGIDINSHDCEDQMTPLHLACNSDHHPEVIRFMLEKGSDPKAIDSDGKTPLFYFSLITMYKRDHSYYYDPIETMKILVEYGADIYHKDIFGETILSHLSDNTERKNLESILIESADVMHKPAKQTHF